MILSKIPRKSRNRDKNLCPRDDSVSNPPKIMKMRQKSMT